MSELQAAAERHAGQGIRTSLALAADARWRRLHTSVMYMTLRDRYGPPDGLAVASCPRFERRAAPTRADGHPPAAAVPPEPPRPHSVRHEHGSHGDVREDVAGHPAEEQLAHAAVRIGAHHQHADPGLARLVKERVADVA